MEATIINSVYDTYLYLKIMNAYDEYINQYSQNTVEHTNKYYYLKNRKVSATNPFLILLLSSPLIFIFLVSAFAVDNYLARIVSTVLVFGIIAIVILVSVYSKAQTKKQNQKFIAEAENYWQTVGGPAKYENDKMCEKIQVEKEKFSSENSFVLNNVPVDYLNVYACGFFFTALKNGRADSLKEAINLYEEHLHRIRLENTAARVSEAISDMQFSIDMQMSQINSNLERANSRLRDIENLEFYNTFIKG